MLDRCLFDKKKIYIVLFIRKDELFKKKNHRSTTRENISLALKTIDKSVNPLPSYFSYRIKKKFVVKTAFKILRKVPLARALSDENSNISIFVNF